MVSALSYGLLPIRPSVTLLFFSRLRMWVFRAWGRLGTTVGGNKLEQFDSIHSAVHDFKRLYEEKTANRWENRKDFVKVPGRFFPMDLDYGDVCFGWAVRGVGGGWGWAVREGLCRGFAVWDCWAGDSPRWNSPV